MRRRNQNKLFHFINEEFFNFKEFLKFLNYYSKKKIINFGKSFEKNKNSLVKFFLMKRGRYNRPFLHLTTMGVLGVGVLVAPYLATTYPIFASQDAPPALASSSAEKQSALAGEDVFKTNISTKPRDKVITYQVERGDTLETIAQKFGISENTIRWANDLKSDDLSVDDTLQILPVSGIAYKVASGDTIYSIAKKYNTDPQKIADFPFNEFAGDGTSFALITGQTLIVPDGTPPTVKPTVQNQSQYTIPGSGIIASGGLSFPVPANTGISQYASWYHMALDITSPVGTPVYAAQNGTVSRVSIGGWDTGYGTNIWISDGNGTETHYAHLSSILLSEGTQVFAGKTVIGYSGNTGRSTGPHTHFEVRKNGALVNPLPFVQ